MSVLWLLLIIVALLIVGPRIIRSTYKRGAERELKNTPELATFPDNERGEVWLKAISRVLLRPYIIAVWIIIAVGLALASSMLRSTAHPYMGPLAWGLIFGVLIAVLGPIVRRLARVELKKLADNKTHHQDSRPRE